MIVKVGATMGALLPVAAAVAADKGATVATASPVIWHALGYPFEAGSMIAGLCACFAVRFYVVQKDFKVHRWALDIPVTSLVMMFTAAAMVSWRPEPLGALLIGTGLGAIGAGIIAIAKRYVDQWIGRFTGGTDA